MERANERTSEGGVATTDDERDDGERERARDDGDEGARTTTTRDYAREAPKNWTSKWSWSALDGGDRATRGANGRVLFEPPALHEDARRGRVDAVREKLNAKTFDLEAKDPAGRTALHFAVGFGREDVVRELLERGCELEPRDDWKKAPVDWGLQAKHDKCVEMLRVEAVKRGIYGGKGKVAPLQTYVEHCYDITTEELQDRVRKLTEDAHARYKQTLDEDTKNYDAIRARAALRDKLKVQSQGRKRR